MNRSAACRCDRRVAIATKTGRVRPDALHFVPHGDAVAGVGEMEQLHDLASLMRSHPDYRAPETVRAVVRGVIESGTYRLLD